MRKNAFCFTLKSLFVLKIYKFLYSLSDHAENRLEKDKFNFKIHVVTTWEKNSCNTHIAWYLKK